MFISKKLFQEALTRNDTTQRNFDETHKLLLEARAELTRVKQGYAELQKAHDELRKRLPNFEALVMAFRDCEVGGGLIQITRVDPDQVFLWGRK